jgi:hypothetical protein
MKKILLLLALMLFFVGSSFADTTYNNYIGFNPFWFPFGNPDTSTYGEIFTAPSAPDTNLASFGFWMADPVATGDIILGGYIATWTGTNAGTLLYSSGAVDYPNVGEAEISFTTGGLAMNPGQQYVMFLSVSQFSGQSVGQAQVDAGSSIPGLNGFAYYNNGGDFNALFTNPWDAQGISPDWAVELNFTGGNGVPEPGTLMMLGTGLLGGLGVLRRKLF